MMTSGAAVVSLLLLLLLTAAEAKEFKVVALGDSFTEGWDPTTKTKIPYTKALLPCLKKNTNGAVNIVVHNKGTGWAGVLMSEGLHPGGNLTKNVMEFVQATRSSGTKYNWAVLWIAGVNDLSNARPPKPFPFAGTIKKYQYLWKLCLDQGWSVLVLPQPTLKFGANVVEPARVQLVAMLKAAVLKAKSRRLRYLDVSAMFDGVKTNPALRYKFISGGVHLSTAGYAKVGLEVCKVLTPYAKRA